MAEKCISKRLPLFISISFPMLLLIAIVTAFFRVEERMKNECRRMAEIGQYTEENYSSERLQDDTDLVGTKYVVLEPFASRSAHI